MAPLKKKNALLSSSEPANSSMLNGPGGSVGDRGAVEVGQAEAVEDRPRLLLADEEVVERRVVVDVLLLADQAVVGDDGDVGIRGGLEDLRERRAVDRGDDQGLGALGDHVLDLRDLGGDVVLGVLEVDGEALAPRAAALTASPSWIQRSELLVGIATPIRPPSPPPSPEPLSPDAPPAHAESMSAPGRNRGEKESSCLSLCVLSWDVIVWWCCDIQLWTLCRRCLRRSSDGLSVDVLVAVVEPVDRVLRDGDQRAALRARSARCARRPRA